jgi:hypothetical protein
LPGVVLAPPELVAPPASAARHPQSHNAATLADVREPIQQLPKDHRERSTWRCVAALLADAAAGADTADVSIALRMVLSMEGVECQPD